MDRNKLVGDHVTATVQAIATELTARQRVRGLTHQLYRYPARFPPGFVRSVIGAFTQPGDLVLDPFVGGGTCGVEALALGRRFVGCDVNELAVFVSKAKTTLLTEQDGRELLEWGRELEGLTQKAWFRSVLHDKRDPRIPWTIRKSMVLGLAQVRSLSSTRLKLIARATLLRAGQWALDGRKHIPSRPAFMEKHRVLLSETVVGARALTTAATKAFASSLRQAEGKRRVVLSPAQKVTSTAVLPRSWGKPRLILTSPPYHGVHILYHRWQVRGRRETDAPYWLSGVRDGRSASYYTFGPRVTARGPRTRAQYFAEAQASFSKIARVCDQETLVAQLVGFSQPSIHLPLYREAMHNAGFMEVLVGGDGESALRSRKVPNRKWYLDALGRTTAASHEFFLMHRLNS